MQDVLQNRALRCFGFRAKPAPHHSQASATSGEVRRGCGAGFIDTGRVCRSANAFQHSHEQKRPRPRTAWLGIVENGVPHGQTPLTRRSASSARWQAREHHTRARAPFSTDEHRRHRFRSGSFGRVLPWRKGGSSDQQSGHRRTSTVLLAS